MNVVRKVFLWNTFYFQSTRYKAVFLILWRSLQLCRRIFLNLSLSKVEKTVKGLFVLSQVEKHHELHNIHADARGMYSFKQL